MEEETAMHVVVVGNPLDGFILIGPFADAAEAADYVDTCDLEAWVAALEPIPNKDEGH